MSSIDLSDATIENLCQSFSSLREVPNFSVSSDIDVHILFFKRKDKYFGIRSGLKSEFDSPEKFLVYSFLVEKITTHAKNGLALEQLRVEECSSLLLNDVYRMGKNIDWHIPHMSDVKHSYLVGNNSEINWAFLEDEMKYHSVFWVESESRLFARCA